jgi:glutaredoxin
MTPKRIRLFIKPYCPWCHDAVAWLQARGLPYEELDVTANAAARAQMFALSGQSRAPVIEVDNQVLADFDTGRLEQWWQQMDFAGRRPTDHADS